MYLSPEAQEVERRSYSDAVLDARLKAALNKLNPAVPHQARLQARTRALALANQNAVASNELFHEMLMEGITEERQQDGETIGVKVRLIDFDIPLNIETVKKIAAYHQYRAVKEAVKFYT